MNPVFYRTVNCTDADQIFLNSLKDKFNFIDPPENHIYSD